MFEYKGPTYVDENGELKMGYFIKTPYNFDSDENSRSTGTSCPEEEDMAQQQFKDECNINVIVERFGVTGEIPQNIRQPMSSDFVDVIDYQTAQNALIEARNSFMQMDAKTRKRFDNDPAKFVSFFELEENRAEAEKLGLINPKAPPPSIPQTGAQPPVQGGEGA